MADDHEERFRQHEAILESLARMLAAQHEMNQQQVEINRDVKTTLARIETLLAHMIEHGENGRD
jgi:hypothetical protein